MTVLPGVLDGVNAVEFVQNARIPHRGRLLAGLGADVVKVEPPTGDAMRLVATSGMPLRMEKARCEVRGPSPLLAEHTADVMDEIGLDPQTGRGTPGRRHAR